MYFFEAPIKVGHFQKEVLVVFSGQLEGQQVDYAYKLEREYRRFDSRPEEVFFIYPNYLTKELTRLFNEGSSFHRNLTRFGQDIPATVLSFGIRGQLEIVKAYGDSALVSDLFELHGQIVDRGMYSLARTRKDLVIQKAPSGCVFLKPSNAESDEFIKASELAVGYAENQFVGFCLLSKAPHDRKINRIYIDTHSISPFIETLVYYWMRFSENLCKTATYKSFSSYGGKEKAKPEDTDDVWLIISASTSNRLGIEMAEEWGLAHSQVITLLSYKCPKDGKVGDNILVNIASLSGSAGKSHSYDSLMKVRVWGENFTVEADKPNEVAVLSDHKTNAVANFVFPRRNSGCFVLNKNSPTSGKVKSIFLNSEIALKDDQHFNDWLMKIVDWYVPAKVGWLVYNKADEASRHLAHLVEGQLNRNGIDRFDSIDLNEAYRSIRGSDCVVVLVPVIGSGQSLLKLNRNLRISGHTGNRVFISPFVVSSSQSTFEQFKKSLTYGPAKLKYLFYSWKNVFVGHQNEVNSWELELKVAGSLDSDFWKSRANVLRSRGVGLNGLVGTPSSSAYDRLDFTNDFAFWGDDKYDPDTIDHEAVYVTMSSVLQGLRERKYSINDKNSLFSHVYQHSVISPDNFSRFTDSLLQSCLWRAANASELDYRSSAELSQDFVGIIERLIEEHACGANNASLDLLMGIAVGRILLHRGCLEILVSKARQVYSENNADASLLLDFIGLKYLNETRLENDEKLVF